MRVCEYMLTRSKTVFSRGVFGASPQNYADNPYHVATCIIIRTVALTEVHVMLIIKKDDTLCFPRIPGVLNARGGLVGGTGPEGACSSPVCLYQAAVMLLLFPVVPPAIGQRWCSQDHLCTGNMSEHSSHYECLFFLFLSALSPLLLLVMVCFITAHWKQKQM